MNPTIMQKITDSEKQEKNDLSGFEECSHKHSQNGTISCIKCGKIKY